MKILITGGSGFLGKNLVEYFSDNHEVIFTSRKKINDPRSRQFDFVSEELSEEFDVIIHNAAYIPKPEDKNDILCKKINVEGSCKFIESALKKCRNFVYIGSLSIFGGNEGIVFVDTSPKPDSDYSLSKFQAEKFIDKGYIIRPGTIYGNGMDSDRFISFANRSLKNNFDIDLFYHDQEFHLIHVDDLVAIINFIITNEPKERFYNLTTEKLTKLEICKKIRRYYGSTSKINIVSDKLTIQLKKEFLPPRISGKRFFDQVGGL